jgi:sugar/nucleoside kinase (ribokinase family)
MSVEEWCDLAVNFEVISPNLIELRHILNIDSLGHEADTEFESMRLTEEAATLFRHQLQRASERDGRLIPTVVVRAGKYGCYTLSAAWSGWTPAYWQQGEQDQVIDPTGGGNGFLGGFGAGMILTGDDVRMCESHAGKLFAGRLGLMLDSDALRLGRCELHDSAKGHTGLEVLGWP